jgi:pimeloyl-ACP methyl ester carboxylesterase
MAHLTYFLRCAVKTSSSAKPIVQTSAFKSQIRLLSSPKQDACFLNLGGGRKVAYRKLEPSDPRKPTLVFVPGFMSSMEGYKATMLDTLCKKQGVGYVRFVTVNLLSAKFYVFLFYSFDFEGMGLSPGSFETVLFRHWYEDVRSVLEKLVPNKALLVGSSMGGWVHILRLLG